jgi:MGT family glycosyltransferase
MTAYMFNMPYHGHINPCLALIWELSTRGEHVVCYSTERFRKTVENAGAEFRSFEHEETEKSISLCTMAEWQLRITEQTLDALIADTRRERPAYLIVDYTCLWGRFIAEHLKLPTVVMHTTYPVARSHTQSIYSTLREALKTPRGWWRLRRFWAASRRVSRRWRVTALATPYELLYAQYGGLHLILTSPEMAGDISLLDDRYVFVGPCVRETDIAQAETLPSFDERPLLYVSLGTFWKQSADIYRAVIEAFGGSQIQVLITGRERVPEDVLRSLPANFHVREHVDQIAVLRRADAFITHGGMNSVCEALLAEVPMLVCPLGFDQFHQARYVERVGCGFSLENVVIDGQRIRSRVELLLQDARIRENCRRTRESLARFGGAPKAAKLVMQFAEASRSSCSAERQSPAREQTEAVRVHS